MEKAFIQDSLYITLQYLRTVDGQNKYHWGIYASGNEPPRGTLLHATDKDREALDLYKDVRTVSNPLNSSTMIVILRFADSPGIEVLQRCASSIRLMDPRYLPRGESRWTCRVWVKEVISSLHKNRCIKLSSGVDTIEQWCQYTADHRLQQIAEARAKNKASRHLGYKGTAKVFNDLSWMSTATSGGSAFLSPDTSSSSRRYYGSSPMDIDPTTRPRYYGSSPMVIDSTGGRYYGPSPMVTETHYNS